MELKADLIDAGSFIMGENQTGLKQSVKIQHTPDFDRATQIKMYSFSHLKIYYLPFN